MANQQVEQHKESPVDRLKSAINSDSVQKQFQNAMAENAGPFTASVIDLYGSDTYLQKCEPALVIMEALKAAVLKLPINKQLGFAYVIPYKNKPQFQIGYKGYIQLAMRTGQYRFLNAGTVSEGQSVERNTLTGETKIIGDPKKSAKVIGYFCYMELLNGFTKTVYMTKAEVTAHGKKYSKSFNKADSAWKTDFDAMALKTVVRRLLSKFGVMSVEMQTALTTDTDDSTQNEINDNANGEVLDLEPEEEEDDPEPEEEPAAPAGPGY